MEFFDLIGNVFSNADVVLGLLGSGVGAVIRFIPEIFKLLTAKADRAHSWPCPLTVANYFMQPVK